jgi:hypothetical protein
MQFNDYTHLEISTCKNIIDEINNTYDDSECKKIVIENAFEYIQVDKIDLFLRTVIKKMRKGSSITLIGIDSYAVCKDYISKKISIEDFNLLIHGKPGTVRTASISLHGLVSYLRNEFGLRVIHQCLSGYNYNIEAIRE